jgi:hypothetical protein
MNLLNAQLCITIGSCFQVQLNVQLCIAISSFWSQLSYSDLNSSISFLDEVFRLLFYQTTLSYSGLNSVILVSTQVFRF